MGDVIPFPRRIVQPAPKSRHQTGRLSSLKPERLSSILRDAERGRIIDWADLCDRMVRYDAAIRANYITRLAATAGARWEMKPGRTGDPKRDEYAEAAARFCEERMRENDGVDLAVMELLDGVGVGVGVEEMDWVWTGSWWTVEQLRFVHQRQLEWKDGWELRLMDRGDGQSAAGGQPLTTWPRKFVVHAPREVAQDPACTGILHSVAWLYLFKRWALEFWVHGAERFAWPMTLGTVKRNASDEARAKLLQTLERFTLQHSAVVDEGDLVQLIESQMKDGGTWKNLKDTLNAEIGQAILGSVDQTAPTEVGAWKAVESRKATTVDSRLALDERQLASTWRRDVLTPMLEFNTHLFGGVLPAIPHQRWVIAEKRREIPQHLVTLKLFSKDEVRGSIGYEPLEEGGDELVGGDDPDPREPAPPLPAT